MQIEDDLQMLSFCQRIKGRIAQESLPAFCKLCLVKIVKLFHAVIHVMGDPLAPGRHHQQDLFSLPAGGIRQIIITAQAGHLDIAFRIAEVIPDKFIFPGHRTDKLPHPGMLIVKIGQIILDDPMLKKGTGIFQQSGHLQSITDGRVRLAALLGADILAGCKIIHPVFQAPVAYSSSQPRHPGIIRRIITDRIDDLLVRMMLSDIPKQPVRIVPGLHLIIADQPQIRMTLPVDQSKGKRDQEFENMQQVRRLHHLQFIKDLLFHIESHLSYFFIDY